MKSLKVDYKKDKDIIQKIKGEQPENWIDTCERYNDDVHRIRDIADMEPYTGLFECIDDDNNSFYYIVEEDKALYKYKRRNVYEKLGI